MSVETDYRETVTVRFAVDVDKDRIEVTRRFGSPIVILAERITVVFVRMNGGRWELNSVDVFGPVRKKDGTAGERTSRERWTSLDMRFGDGVPYSIAGFVAAARDHKARVFEQ